MILPRMIPVIAILSIAALSAPISVKDSDRTDLQTNSRQSRDSIEEYRKWQIALNAQDTSLEELYIPNAILVSHPDSICSGPSEIGDYHKGKKDITEISSLFTTEAHKDRGISYEIITYESLNSQRFHQLVIYENGNQKLRAFEYEEVQAKSPQVDTTQISERRKRWMELCNAHRVEDLVNDLYSENTMYYNHRPLVRGTGALITEYSYMNKTNYSLSLHPLIVHLVNDSTVFEIGQCKGSYGGKYILIWKKEEDGQWRIFIDSNV